jgi:hypothetical protein
VERLLTLVTATLLIGLTFGTAHADAFAPAANPYLQRYEQVATRYWGDVPDCEQVEYLWPAEDPFGNDDALAYADIGGCRMWLVYWEPLKGASSDRWEAYAFNCDTFVHEWGHLVGFDHDAEGFRSGRLYDACDRAADARYTDVEALKPATRPAAHHRPKRRCRGSCATFAKDFDDGSTLDPIEAGGHLRKR